MNSQPQSSSDLTERPLEICARRRGASVAVALAGALDLAAAPRLERFLRDAEEVEIGTVVVDLAEVNFIDSIGLAVLLTAKRRCEGRLTVSPSRHEAVTRLLALTGATEMLDC